MHSIFKKLGNLYSFVKILLYCAIYYSEHFSVLLSWSMNNINNWLYYSCSVYQAVFVHFFLVPAALHKAKKKTVEIKLVCATYTGSMNWLSITHSVHWMCIQFNPYTLANHCWIGIIWHGFTTYFGLDCCCWMEHQWFVVMSKMYSSDQRLQKWLLRIGQKLQWERVESKWLDA